MTAAYLAGFGNEHESEALPGALPRGRFSPQQVAFGLYAEQFSSTAFTVPARNEPPHLVLPYPPIRAAGCLPTGRPRVVANRPVVGTEPSPGPDALEPHRDSAGAGRLRRRPGDHGGERRLCRPHRHRHSSLSGQSFHGRPILLQCRRRTPARPATGRPGSGIPSAACWKWPRAASAWCQGG